MFTPSGRHSQTNLTTTHIPLFTICEIAKIQSNLGLIIIFFFHLQEMDKILLRSNEGIVVQVTTIITSTAATTVATATGVNICGVICSLIKVQLKPLDQIQVKYESLVFWTKSGPILKRISLGMVLHNKTTRQDYIKILIER